MRSLGLVVVTIALSVTGSILRAEEPAALPPQTLSAAKLAGLAGFVNVSCDTLRTDGERFKGAIRAMGVDPAELDRGALMLQARSYLVAYQKDLPGSCTRAEALFGQSGRIIPGIFVPR
ncbi:hypothetical protein MKK69_20285 [Methylobacterium sp. J-026]|uniref:hypothetical protein n=1 Tax=Methylobacterium sp. J-026 TaxID=2836624 RepID=UPI001FBB1EF5|nr:hypothetical protein [Methylobacterium sp. J-026]MCJ2136359.1 hypothetical protein [Methylobacterium sp. J-026]